MFTVRYTFGQEVRERGFATYNEAQELILFLLQTARTTGRPMVAINTYSDEIYQFPSPKGEYLPDSLVI